MKPGEKDALGNIAGETYSASLHDPAFERRLKAFDPYLSLRLNLLNKCWYVLERARVGQGYNILFKCANDDGTPKGLGEWVFNKLFVMRHNYNELIKDPDQWWKNFEDETEKEKVAIAEKGHKEQAYKLTHDVNQWRRAWRDFVGLPKSDVTAGYPKVQTKKKESACLPLKSTT